MVEGLTEISKHKIVIVGEQSSSAVTVGLETAIQSRLIMKPGILHVVLQHFNFEMQYLLDDFMVSKISFV